MDIKAAVVRSPSAPFTIETLSLEPPRPDEILVRIVGAGVCHTDLVAASGALPLPFPAVLGHEGSGVVEAVGAGVAKVAPGDHVVLTFRSCGACPRCADHDPAYCDHLPELNFVGARPDGSTALSAAEGPVAGSFFGQSSFATHAIAYERNVVKVTKDAPLWLLGPLGCGVQTGAGAAMNALACRSGSSLVVIGGGSVGLSAVMGAVIQGCGRIVVVEPHAGRRDLALSLGATDVIDPEAHPDIAARVREALGAGADYAIDTTGRPELLQAALACLAKKGMLGVLGISPPGAPTPGAVGDVMVGGLTIRGIIEGDSDPDVFIPELVELYRAGRLPIDRLVTPYAFDDINAAVDDQHAGRCVKVVLLHDMAEARA